MGTVEPMATQAVVAADSVLSAPAELSVVERLVNSLESRNTAQTVIIITVIVGFVLIKLAEILGRGEDPIKVLTEALTMLTTPGGAVQVERELRTEARRVVHDVAQAGTDTLEGLILTLSEAQRAAIAHAVMTLSSATDYDETHPELVAELYKLVNDVAGDVNSGALLDSIAGAALTPATDGT